MSWLEQLKPKKKVHPSVKTHMRCMCVRRALFVCGRAGFKPKQRHFCDVPGYMHLHIEEGGWCKNKRHKWAVRHGGAGWKTSENSLPHVYSDPHSTAPSPKLLCFTPNDFQVHYGLSEDFKAWNGSVAAVNNTSKDWATHTPFFLHLHCFYLFFTNLKQIFEVDIMKRKICEGKEK